MNKTILTKSLSLAFVLLVSSLSGCGPNVSNPDSSEVVSSEMVVSKNNNYVNPTYPLVNDQKEPTYLADPYVIRDEESSIYYMYGTQTEVNVNDSLVKYFVRGPVFESIDLVNWRYKSNVFADYVPNWGKSSAGVWAPTVVKIGNYYNFYYSLSIGGDDNPGIGVARSLTPYGPFEHYGKLFSSNEIGVTNSIDPHVFIDDGKVYMVFGSYGGLITLLELTSDGLGLKGGLEEQVQNKVALGGYSTYEMNNYEGAMIIKYDSQYFLFLSTGTCCSGAQSTYNVVVAKSNNVAGPYLDSHGRDLFGPKRGDQVVVPSLSGAMGVGHNGIAQDDLGEYWIIYHGFDTQGVKPDWRVTYLDRLSINEETGMFEVKGKKASNHVELPGPYIASLEEGLLSV